MGYRFILLLVLFAAVLIFTFVLKRTNNPLTDLVINYYDETIDPDDKKSVIHELVSIDNPFSYLSVYAIKTKNPVNVERMLYYSRIYGIQLVDCYIYVILSRRYTVTSIQPHGSSVVFQVKDDIIKLPLVSFFAHYHVFNLIFDRSAEAESIESRVFGQTLVSSLYEKNRGMVQFGERIPKTSIVFSDNSDGIKLSNCKSITITNEAYDRQNGTLFKVYTIRLSKFWN